MSADIDEQPPVLIAQQNGIHNDREMLHLSRIQEGNDVSIEQEEFRPEDSDIVVGEKDLIGQVVEGSDGEYYLVAPNDDAEAEVEIDEISHVKIMVGSDGSRMFVVDGKGETANGSDSKNQTMDDMQTRGLQQYQQVNKGRRNRVYGSCRCTECGQTFVNTARLERHLAVHQIFGNYNCPLCSKTYKYEYNLFYHWRKTCRDLDEVFSQNERKDLDVNTLRAAVEDLVRKKRDYGGLELVGINGQPYYRYPEKLPFQVPYAQRVTSCKACGISVVPSHLPHHMNLHRGRGQVGLSDNGAYFCDLCGLMFRQEYNLFKHWRTVCPEIQANLQPDQILSDDELKILVMELIQAVAIDHAPPEPQTVKEKARMYNDITVDLDYEGNEDRTNQVVFTDDMVDEEGNYSLMENNRAKWLSGAIPVQCHECKRAFANPGRLERHMAGYHASSGSHHCPLCGNRFKYDYNLLYHYRRSCPYTRSFIETDMRQQLDAQTLRKLVRSLAAKELRITPDLGPTTAKKEEFGDNFVRKEMLGRDTIKNLAQLPPNRPGIPEGKNCPLCGITFYGLPVLNRHVQAAHPRDAYMFDQETGGMKEAVTVNRAMTMKQENQFSDDLDDSGDMDDQPPELEKISDTIDDDHGPLHLVDADGNVISEVRDLNEVQQLIDSGELGLRPSDRFVLMDRNHVIHSEVVYEDGQHFLESEQNEEIYYEMDNEPGTAAAEVVVEEDQELFVEPSNVKDVHVAGPSTCEMVEKSGSISPRRSGRKRTRTEMLEESPKEITIVAATKRITKRSIRNESLTEITPQSPPSRQMPNRNSKKNPRKSPLLPTPTILQQPRRSLRHK